MELKKRSAYARFKPILIGPRSSLRPPFYMNVFFQKGSSQLNIADLTYESYLLCKLAFSLAIQVPMLAVKEGKSASYSAEPREHVTDS